MEELTMIPRLYANGRIALQLMCENGESWGTLSVNLVDAEIADDEMGIPVWNLPEERIAAFLESGQFVDTGKTAPAGYVEAPIWRVVCPKLLAAFARLREQA